MLFDMNGPKPFGLAFQPFDRPLWPQHGSIVSANAFPAFALGHPAFMDHSDEMPDGGRGTFEAGPVVLAAFAHRRHQHFADKGLVGRAKVRLQRHAGGWRHVGDGIDELAQIAFHVVMQFDDLHESLDVVLEMNRACYADRLVGRAEMHVATGLGSNVAPQAAHPPDVIAFCGLAELPPDMTLALTLSRDPAAFDNHGGLAEVALQMGTLRGDVAGVDVDDDGLHLQDFRGFGLAGGGNGAGDHVDGGPFPRSPRGEGRHLVRRLGIRLDPSVMRAAVDALTLVDETADRDQPVTIAEDNLHELGDLHGVRLVAEDIDHRGRVVEIPPGVEMDEILLRGLCPGLMIIMIGGHCCFLGCMRRVGHLGRVGRIVGCIGHAASPQHRSACEQNRHSKKSRLAAIRGNRSPASVA